MSSLEDLKTRLMVKPNISSTQKQFTVAIKEKEMVKNKENTKNTKKIIIEEPEPEPETSGFTIVDETKKGYDRESLMKKIASNRLSKVTQNPLMEKIQETIVLVPEMERKKEKGRDKKKLKKLIILEEEEVKEPEEEQKENINVEEENINVEKEPEEEQKEKEEKNMDVEEDIIIVPKKRERKSKKAEKGLAVLGPETKVEITDRTILDRLPPKQPNVNIKVSSYYMNNREIFINFINSILEPYKKELDENAEKITCENIGQSNGSFSLLTHQKVVRDYMNLYTPYRGILLYHSLGSGKSCTSIALAEGMKDSKRVIVMTPASLRRNYMEELKKCGDPMYKKNQFWEFIPTTDPERVKILSQVLNLSAEYIKKHGGAWLVNIKKQSNYPNLSAQEKKSLDDQIDEMIRSKYTFINYNGLRNKRLEELTNGYTKNLFDDCVIIIDEAHNLISRIVNKIKKEKPIAENSDGDKEHAPKFLSTKLYEYLMSATNARIILLSGTPIINYPNEFGILFNILRGYIKTWHIPLEVKTSKATNRDTLKELFLKEKVLDYLDYTPSSRTLTITRNPFGFKNKVDKKGYHGVSNNRKNDAGETDFDNDLISDDAFKKRVMSILKSNDIEVLSQGIKVKNYKALPDDFDLFNGEYIESTTNELKNIDSLKRRIIGLTSYFRSAQEGLLPKFNKTPDDYHILNIQMSNFQFKIYEDARKEERKLEKQAKKKGPAKGADDIYKEPSSTYRIFSRLFCNYVMPNRPTPGSFKMEIQEKAIKIDNISEKNISSTIRIKLEPILENILGLIPEAGEKEIWTNKINIRLNEYVRVVLKGEKSNSDKKINELIKYFNQIKKLTKISKENKKIIENNIDNFEKQVIIFTKEIEEERDKIKEEEREKEKEDIKDKSEINSSLITLLKEAKKVEEIQDVNNDEEGEVEGDEILERVGGKDYKERIENIIYFLNEHAKDYLTPEALETYSPKFLSMLENIQDPEYIGLHLVYSQFRTLEGIGIFSLVLNKNGFARFKIKKNALDIWELDMKEEDLGKPTYALYTGTETAEEKEIIRNIYNSSWDYIPTNIANELKKIANNNNLGEIIKVLMITSSGSEGINLRNTRFVHIMEPYWHPVRMEQVIGRARRICSHKDLPVALQTVEVFVYLMVFSAEQLKSDDSIELKNKDLSKSLPKVPVTSDQYLFEISNIKENISSQLTKIIKETSFDCNLYPHGLENLVCMNFADPTNTAFSYSPDYSKQQSDVSIKSNKKKIEWTGKAITIYGIEYVYRRMSPQVLNIYDLNSYKQALENSDINPILIGTLEINNKGEQVFKMIS